MAKKKKIRGKKITTQELQAHVDEHVHPADIGYAAAQERIKERKTENAQVEKTEEPKPRLQCEKCPWKTSTNPHEIPHGYCPVKHAGLKGTIAKEGEYNIVGGVRVMACHDSPIGKELVCVGWFDNQMGRGNNIGLRLAVMAKRIDPNVQIVGPQHERFEDTLPQNEKEEEEE